MRKIVQVARVTATSGATADTGLLELEEFHSLGVIVTVTGLASGAVTGYAVDEASNQNTYYAVASIPIGGSAALSLGRDAGGGAAPVPRNARVTAVSGASGTVVIFVYGVADEPDNV